jgi:nicotinamide phosphoribosyltransferase
VNLAGHLAAGDTGVHFERLQGESEMSPSNAMSPLFLIDFYKAHHHEQYPPDTQQVWSNWTARSSRVPDQHEVIWFGLQKALMDLEQNWDEHFFKHCWPDVEAPYKEFMAATMGIKDAPTEHIRKVWEIGHLPLDVWALSEGTRVPLGVPMFVITNTHPEAYWLPNYLETFLSNALWKATTSATTAFRFRELFKKYARLFGEKDLSFVDWQGHDFSYRGMSGLEDAQLSGMGHLLSFNGTDTIPAILAAKKYYDAPLSCGASVPATEHSVMCAGGQEGEFETFRRLITETYKSGIVSIVSDTWDLWKVLTDYVPRLRQEIQNRDGKVVIRPDSGDPVKIMNGDNQALIGTPAWYGALSLLEQALGTDGQGHINKAGLIYGDGISLERAEAILSSAVKRSLSPYNVVFGIGSYTYTYVTRDEYGFAMKATAVRRGGQILDIFKKPVTSGDFNKASLKGIPVVLRDDRNGRLYAKDGATPEMLDQCAFRKVFKEGHLQIHTDFETIRKRVRT